MKAIALLVGLFVFGATPVAVAQDEGEERTGSRSAPREESGRSVWRVAEVNRSGQSLVLEPISVDPGAGPLGNRELTLEWAEFSGRMEAGSGHPLTLDNVREGALVHVWFEEEETDDREVLWIVFPTL